jgi:hypothetical protein
MALKALDRREHVGNRSWEQKTNGYSSRIRGPAMLAFAITVLFTVTGLVAVAVVADSLVAARAAWVRLMREGGVMRAGLALQAAALDMSLRPAPAARRAMAARVPAPRRPQPLQACAAA